MKSFGYGGGWALGVAAALLWGCSGEGFEGEGPEPAGVLERGVAELSDGGTVVWKKISHATVPGRSYEPQMVFDRQEGKIVLFHPEDRSMWTWDGSDWTRIPWPEGEPSPGERSAGLTYDEERFRIVLYGGFGSVADSGCQRCNDTWEWFGNPPRWVQRTDVGAAGDGRNSHALAYDRIRKVTVLAGGLFGTPDSSDSDTWEYDGTRWVRTVASGDGYLPGRRDPAMVFDEARGEIVLFGGSDITGGTTYSDTWVYNGSWQEKNPAFRPAPRRRHRMAYDSVRQRVILYGGGVDNAQVQWEWDGATWTRATLTEPFPGMRQNHAMAFDPIRRRLVLFGGDSVFTSDTWEMYVRGNTCTTADDCHTGFCVDGVCCETACDGLCEACAQSLTGQPDGVCAPIPAGQDPEDECPAGVGLDEACLPGVCDGSGACRIHVDAVCQAAFCVDGSTVQEEAVCDAAGSCVVPAPLACGEQVCVDGACVAPPPACVGDGDCAPGEICDAGTCVPAPPACIVDGDCAAGEVCDNGTCVPAPPACIEDGDCAAGEVCDNGTCVPAVPACTVDEDCAADEVCDHGTCVPAGPACTVDGDCPAGQVCEAGSCVPVSGACTGDEDCEAGEVCEAGACIPTSPVCAEDGDCAAEEVCEAGACVPAPEDAGRIVLGGGGGCSSAGGQGPGGATLLPLLLLGLGLIALRERKGAGGRASTALQGAACLSLAVPALLAPSSAAAQKGFDANRFQASPLASDGLMLQRPQTLEGGSFGASLTFSYARSPLMERRIAADGRVLEENALIADQLFAHLGAAYGLLDELTLFATLPVALLQDGPASSPHFQGGTLASTAIGDLRLGGRLRLLGGAASAGALGLEASLFLPTGDAAAFASDGKVRFAATLQGEVLPTDYLYLGANAGLQTRPASAALGAEGAPELLLSGGAGYRSAEDRWRLGVEANLLSRLEELSAAERSGVEALGVASLRMTEGLVASIGAGPGFTDGLGTPEFRAVARIGWAVTGSGAAGRSTAGREALRETKAEEPPAPTAEESAEADAEEAPAAAVVEEPEAKAAPADRDGDGIPDEEDACPDQAGVAQADVRRHGCPATAVLRAVEERIEFEVGLARISASGARLLDRLARELRDNPEVRLSVEGHTDSTGSEALNLRLSRERAQAVVDALVERGVDPARLRIRGWGYTRPIADNATVEGRARNRRVEFHLER